MEGHVVQRWSRPLLCSLTLGIRQSGWSLGGVSSREEGAMVL